MADVLRSISNLLAWAVIITLIVQVTSLKARVERLEEAKK